MFTEEGKENHKWLCDVRGRIIDLLEEEGVTNRVEATRVLASTLNEIFAPTGDQAIVILRPLVAYREVDDKT